MAQVYSSPGMTWRVVRLFYFMHYNTKETFKIYVRHAKKVKGFAFLIFLCSLFATILGDLITPIFYKYFFDTLVQDVDFDIKKALLLGVVFKILLLSLVSRTLWALGDFMSSKSLVIITRDIFQSCFEYTHKHAINFFNNNFIGSLVKQVNRFVWAFHHLWNTIFWEFIPLVVAIVGICVVLATQNLLLAGIIFLWIIILCISTFFYSRVKLPLDMALSASDSEISGRLADSFTNHENVKFLNGFTSESKTFWDTTTRWHNRARKSWYFSFSTSLFCHCGHNTAKMLLNHLLEREISYLTSVQVGGLPHRILGLQ